MQLYIFQMAKCRRMISEIFNSSGMLKVIFYLGIVEICLLSHSLGLIDLPASHLNNKYLSVFFFFSVKILNKLYLRSDPEKTQAYT